jgi:hypothetical protein
VFETKLVGVTFNDCQLHIANFGHPEMGKYDLVREPGNPYDPNAVKVCFCELQLGYLPKQIAVKLAPLMDAGRTFQALFVCRNQYPERSNTVGLSVRIVETEH